MSQTQFQIVMDCRDPVRMATFWSAALGYVLEPPPEGFASWHDYLRDVGVPENEITPTPDSIVDPSGDGPRIWFQLDDEPKVVKNRLHIDLRVGGGRTVPLSERKTRVEAEAGRLVQLGATRLGAFDVEGVDHYAVGMTDPEGNEFDIN